LERLWKLWTFFVKLNEAYKKFYNPLEIFAVGELTVKFKSGIIFRQYIPKKRKRFGIKIYKLSDKSEYTYDMIVYLSCLTPPLKT